MNTGRALLGLVLVALGSLFLLDQAGVIEAADTIADWWPTIFLAAAVLDLVARPPRPVSAAVFTLMGLGLLGLTTHLIDASVWAVIWPMAVILLGVWLLFRRGPAGGGSRTDDADIDVTVLFSGRRVVSTAHPFRGGTATASDAPTLRVRATAIFGGVDVKLGVARQAPVGA